MKITNFQRKKKSKREIKKFIDYQVNTPQFENDVVDLYLKKIYESNDLFMGRMKVRPFLQLQSALTNI